MRLPPVVFVAICAYISNMAAQAKHVNYTRFAKEASKCDEREFLCYSGKCIPSVLLCDGVPDCPDRSDETRIECNKSWRTKCPVNNFRCDYGACVSADALCNGVKNCLDNSDENPARCSGGNRVSELPKSKITCPILESDSLAVECTAGGKSISCGSTGVASGISAKLTCRKNYIQITNYETTDNVVKCNKKGQWEPEPFDCIKFIVNSTRTTSAPQSSHLATLNSCASLVLTSRSVFCGPKFNETSCDKRMPPGTSVKLRCNNGYTRNVKDLSELMARDEVKCNAYGSWEPKPIECIDSYLIGQKTSTEVHLIDMTTPTSPPPSPKKNYCQLPPQLQNGRYTMSHCISQRNCELPTGMDKVESGMELRYICDAGYKLNPIDSKIYCLPNGTWSVIPVCKAILTCPPLISVSRIADCMLPTGDWISCETTPVPPGTSTKLTCRNSYIKDTKDLTAAEITKCNDKGEWVPKPINCVSAASCPSLESESRTVECTTGAGKMISCNQTSVSPGTSAKLTCRDGYAQETSDSTARDEVKCNIEGKWEPEPMTCFNVAERFIQLLTISNQSSTESYQQPEHATQATPPWSQTHSSMSIGNKHCLLPPQPQNGRYKLQDYRHCPYEPCEIPNGITQVEPGGSIVYACHGSYKLNTSVSRIFCSSVGTWYNIPACVAITCPPLGSASRIADCRLPTDEWISCETSPVPPGTSAKLSCRNSYVKDTKDLTTFERVKCNANGEWDPKPINCVTVCGVASSFGGAPLIAFGSLAYITEFPWHGTLYRAENSKKVFICGATIIKDNILVTAAHCVYDDVKAKLKEASDFYVAVGNNFKDFDYERHDPETYRTARVKEIYVQCSYHGVRGNYATDIAILVIDKPFVFSSLLMPICLDTAGHGDLAMEVGNTGRVPGFGITENDQHSFVLQSITVPYVSQNDCKMKSAQSGDDKFFTPDKFCAGYTNGSTVCHGDSGGGLVFKTTDGKWFLRGIVSTGIGKRKGKRKHACENFTYSLYTRVSYHMSWIQTVMDKVENDKPYNDCH